jgi:hypothetical protein
MTHTERNAVIGKKIAIYTEKFAASRETARAAIKREGLSDKPKSKRKAVA